MGVRDSLNQNPKVAAVVIGVAILAAVGLLIAQLRSTSDGVPGLTPGVKEWFTIDDGKTWFADDGMKLPPFEHQGKIAYRVRVWTCDGGKTTFASHLERINAQAKAKLEQMKPEHRPISPEYQMIEVKPPLTGDQGWVPVGTPQAAEIMTPRCPPGQNPENLQPVPAR
ncbi:MAG TPA: hypothetical protein VNL70_07795 [Tepidisphaeraceae bacterium]|nr:hypothetical protein [Tepidisphaeraceae bacterium]